MKLKKVTVTFEYVIVVEDAATEHDIFWVAATNIKDALNDMSIYDVQYDFEEYTDGSIPDWSDVCIPYGGDGNTTTGQYK